MSPMSTMPPVPMPPGSMGPTFLFNRIQKRLRHFLPGLADVTNTEKNKTKRRLIQQKRQRPFSVCASGEWKKWENVWTVYAKNKEPNIEHKRTPSQWLEINDDGYPIF